MFCSSESWDSAIGLSKRPSRSLNMETVYFLYGPLSLFTRVRGIGFLRTSPFGDSQKLNFRFTEFSEVHLLLDTKVPKIRSLRDMRSPSEE